MQQYYYLQGVPEIKNKVVIPTSLLSLRAEIQIYYMNAIKKLLNSHLNRSGVTINIILKDGRRIELMNCKRIGSILYNHYWLDFKGFPVFIENIRSLELK